MNTVNETAVLTGMVGDVRVDELVDMLEDVSEIAWFGEVMIWGNV